MASNSQLSTTALFARGELPEFDAAIAGNPANYRYTFYLFCFRQGQD
jgi:hypothetical protein